MNPTVTTTNDPAGTAPEGTVYLVTQNGGDEPASGIVLMGGGEICLFHAGRGLGIRLPPARLRELGYALLAEAGRIEGDASSAIWTSRVAGSA